MGPKMQVDLGGSSFWRSQRRKVGFQSSIESALFYLYEGGELCGIMISHVDDLYTAGEGNYFEEAMKRLTKKIHLKEQKGEFKFCGKHIVQQKDGQISIDQTESIETIEYQVIDKSRRSKPGAPLTEDEKSGFRALIGSMGWVTRQSRPDIMVNVSIAAQALGKPTVKDVIDLNKALKMLKETPNAKWNYVPSSITMKNCAVFVCADSSFANLPGHKSQCGYVVGLSLPSLENGEETPALCCLRHAQAASNVCAGAHWPPKQMDSWQVWRRQTMSEWFSWRLRIPASPSGTLTRSFRGRGCWLSQMPKALRAPSIKMLGSLLTRG